MSDVDFPYGQTWTEELEPPRKPRRPVGIIAVSIAVVAVLIAGIGGVVALTGQDTNTPDQAVRGLLTAASNSDVLGVLDSIDPAERDALSGFLINGVADLKRLGVLSSAADLQHVKGVTLSFTGVTTSTSELRPGLDAVTITGGAVHSTFDPSTLPVGSFIQQTGGGALAKTQRQDQTTPIHIDVPIMTIRRGGTWYVSIGYTAAEAARRSAKAALPQPQDAVPAIGADSPTAAVDAFLRAAAALDVRRLIQLTPPDEMGALHDYAPLFLPDVDKAVTELQAGPHAFKATITKLELSAQPHPGGELVSVTQLGLHVTVGTVTVDLAPGARCVSISGVPGRSLGSVPGLCGANGAPNPLPASLAGQLNSLQKLHPAVGIVTVERGGKWYVSPLRTTLDTIEAVLHALTPDILNKLKSAFTSFALPFGSSSGSSFGSQGSTRFVPIGPSIGTQLSPSPGIATNIGPPVTTPCVNGKQTITFPYPAGKKSVPPLTIPCK